MTGSSLECVHGGKVSFRGLGWYFTLAQQQSPGLASCAVPGLWPGSGEVLRWLASANMKTYGMEAGEIW